MYSYNPFIHHLKDVTFFFFFKLNQIFYKFDIYLIEKKSWQPIIVG